MKALPVRGRGGHAISFRGLLECVFTTVLLGVVATPGVAEAQASTSIESLELRLLPEASVQFLDYEPVHSLELLGDSAVVMLDFQARQVEIRSLADGETDRFGDQGGGPGEFTMVADVTVGDDDRIFVADITSHRVSEFSVDGTFRASYQVAGPTMHVMATGESVFTAWTPGSTFRRGGAAKIGEVVRGRDTPRPIFELSRDDVDWPETPEEGPESVTAVPMTAGGGVIFAANPYVYRIIAFSPSGDEVESFGREIALEFPNEAEMEEYERRLESLLERSGDAQMTSSDIDRLKKKVSETAKAFFGPHMFEADERGGLWTTTLLRAPGDSTRIDYFPPGGRDHQQFLLRDRVVALAASPDHLVTLVERKGPEALGRFGLDVYEIRRTSAER